MTGDGAYSLGGGHRRSSTIERKTDWHSLNNQRDELGPTRTGFGYLPSLMPLYNVLAFRGRLPPNNRQTSALSNNSVCIRPPFSRLGWYRVRARPKAQSM